MSRREFHFTEGKSNKFWTIEIDGKSHTIHFGRTGTTGQTQTKKFAGEAEAKKSYDKLIAEKVKKGYVETGVARKLAPPNGPGGELMQRMLSYEMGDADVVDRYLFTLKLDDGLKVNYEGAGSSEDLEFEPEALESATSHIVICQGSASTSDAHSLPDRITSDLPPFLLSRAVFGALKTKSMAQFKFEWSQGDVTDVTVKGNKKLSIVVDGKKKTVPVLHCVGNLYKCELWVIDDDNWPIIVKHIEGDEHTEAGFWFWNLLEAGKDLELDHED